MKVRSPMPCSCSCLSPTRSQRRRRELHGADSDMAQRLETAMAHTLRLGSCTVRTRIWHSDWKPRWLIRYVSAALLSFMDNQVDVYALGAGVKGATREIEAQVGVRVDIAILHLHKKDPRLARMRKIVRLFNEALTEARKVGLPIDGVPVVLRGVLEEEPSPYLSGVVGEFWVQYAAFESNYKTRDPGNK